jgi:hypothetical protein
LISVFALLAICLVAVHPLLLMASSRTGDGKKIPTTIKQSLSPNPVTDGDTLTLTANISSSNATGTVSVYYAFSPKGPFEKRKTIAVKNGVAKASQKVEGYSQTTAVYLKSVYSGSGKYASSTSKVMKLVVKEYY